MTANKVSYCLNFRCHALVAVQGVEQRPQTIGNFNQVLVQLRHIPLTLTLESSSSNASVQPWRSSWASNTSATSEYCITIVPKNTFHFTCLSRTRHVNSGRNFFFIRPQNSSKSSFSGARHSREPSKRDQRSRFCHIPAAWHGGTTTILFIRGFI